MALVRPHLGCCVLFRSLILKMNPNWNKYAVQAIRVIRVMENLVYERRDGSLGFLSPK